ncbi:type II toxin-antitoxin system RelE/ParE family toxin [Empedobacter stercoris]|uniref:type II toxin-antitoxin system RelE/ParE family toxin n=1 Tax=Empedobacter stercoris TaxID=1628248 RepID=UPI0039E8C71D
MINSFEHKGLKELWENNKTNKLPTKFIDKIKRILFVIDSLEEVPEDLLSIPFYKPHPLKGKREGEWALKVSGNYRITFWFDNKAKAAYDINFEDYH